MVRYPAKISSSKANKTLRNPLDCSAMYPRYCEAGFSQPTASKALTIDGISFSCNSRMTSIFVQIELNISVPDQLNFIHRLGVGKTVYRPEPAALPGVKTTSR